MTASEKLTPERIAEIMAFPITYDEDCPKLTKEQIARLRPAHPENFVKEKRQKITVYVDSDVLEKFNATGLDLESYINSSVRTAVAEYGA
ncbi:MAG: BrnA antitoxin family protein [Treponemataceae bacterium]|nr:BrnA antitoxin family protein [Treponemataceae bacterium]